MALRNASSWPARIVFYEELRAYYLRDTGDYFVPLVRAYVSCSTGVWLSAVKKAT